MEILTTLGESVFSGITWMGYERWIEREEKEKTDKFKYVNEPSGHVKTTIYDLRVLHVKDIRRRSSIMS